MSMDKRPKPVTSTSDQQYREAMLEFGSAIERLAGGYEADADKRRDLVQDIHFAIWRSFTLYEGDCSLRTWVYRVAHNTAAKHVVKEQRVTARRWIDLDEELKSDALGPEEETDRSQGLARLMRLIHQLKPLDRQIILLFLEGLEGAAIAEVMGMSPPAIGTRVHRIKQYLTQQFHRVSPEGASHEKV